MSKARIPPAHQYVVDAGCGRGGDSGKWNRSGVKTLLGLDPDEESIVEAQRRSSRWPGFVYLKDSPLEAIQTMYPDSVHVIAWMFSIHYLNPDDQLRCIRSSYAVLRPGGSLIVCFMDSARSRDLSSEVATIQWTSPMTVRVALRDSPYFEKVSVSSRSTRSLSAFVRRRDRGRVRAVGEVLRPIRGVRGA